MHYCVIAKLWMSHDRRGYDATGQYQSNNRRHKLSLGDIPSHGFCETLRHEETFIVGVKKSVFMGHKFGEEATRIPKFVLDVWRSDVADVAGEARDATLYETSGSFDEYVSVVEWTVSQGLTLPGQTPGCLVRSRKGLMRALIPWMTLKPKIPIRLKRIFWPPQHEDAVVCAVVLSATHYERIV